MTKKTHHMFTNAVFIVRSEGYYFVLLFRTTTTMQQKLLCVLFLNGYWMILHIVKQVRIIHEISTWTKEELNEQLNIQRD